MEEKVPWGRWIGAVKTAWPFRSVLPGFVLLNKAQNTEPLVLHPPEGVNSPDSMHLWNAKYLQALTTPELLCCYFIFHFRDSQELLSQHQDCKNVVKLKTYL